MQTMIGLDAKNPLTFEYMKLEMAGETNLIPSKDEIGMQSIKFMVDYILEGAGAEHREICQHLAVATSDQLMEWLGVQMRNRATAEEIKKEL